MIPSTSAKSQQRLRSNAGLMTAPHGTVVQRRTQKTSERIAQEIVHDIVARGLRTGDHLPLEAAMIDEYQVSRASLREALRLLEVQGLIRLKPGPRGGPVVGSVDSGHFARMATLYFHLDASTYGQLLQTQVLLEPLCAQLAAQNPARREAMRPFFDLEYPEGESEYREQALDFHNAVHLLVGNDVLTLLTQAVTSIVSDQVLATMDPVEIRPAIFEQHGELARAIAAGHADKAYRLMAAHYQQQGDYYRTHSPARLEELIKWR